MKPLMTVEESQEKAEAALNYLTGTDEPYASAKAWALASDKLRKARRSQIYLGCDLKTDGQRNHYAESHELYLKAVQDWRDAIYDFELLKAKRSRADITIEFFRSLNSARNKGMV